MYAGWVRMMTIQRKGAKAQSAQRVMEITGKSDKKVSNTVNLCVLYIFAPLRQIL